MVLFPALKISNRVIKGKRTDSHNTLGATIGVTKPTEDSRGFSPDGRLFLSRTQALGFLKKHDRDTYNKLPDEARHGLHSEHLAKAYNIEQKDRAVAIREEAMTKSQDVDLSTKTVMVIDRGGLHTYWAPKLAEKFGKVYFYLFDSDAYPTSLKASIGSGLPKVKRIHDIWKYIDKVDLVVVPDCYDGELIHYLREKGYCVFGSGLGEKLEIDKVYFLELLEKLGLPCPKTYLAEGMDDLCEYLKEHDGETLFLKNTHRGDFESRKFTSMAQSKPFLTDLKKRLGSASDTLTTLVQHKVDSKCEAGWDGYLVDGEYVPKGMCGIELKDQGYVGKVFVDKPEILAQVDDKLSPEFKKLGYRGNYSTEVRITEDGTPYFIDPTCRCPSPPGEVMCEIIENWAEAIYLIASGVIPDLKYKAAWGAEIIVHSDWHKEHEVHVSYPKKYSENIKLKNHTIRDGENYCVENGNDGYAGAVVAWGASKEEATQKCLDIAKEIEIDGFKYDENLFSEIDKSIEAAAKFGIIF